MKTMNNPKPNDFTIDLPGVGSFTFNRKTYGSQIKIDAVMARILGPNWGGEGMDATMSLHARLVATYSALMVSCPLGWQDLEEIDLTDDPDKDNQILDLYFALRGKLDSFRVQQGNAGAKPAGQESGAGNAPNDGVLAAPQVPAAAE